MSQSEYMIGTTQAGMVNLEALTIPVSPPKFTYEPYSKALPLGDGSVRGGGWAKGSWTWDILPAEERDQLRAFCPGASSMVFIQTRVNSNSESQIDHYKTFRAVMIWPTPEGEREMGGYRLDFTIQFQALVEVS